MELICKENDKLLIKGVCHPSDANILTAAGYEYRNELDRTEPDGYCVETWEKRPNLRLLECVFDIAYSVGYNAAGGQYIADDSREAFQLVLSWAREFEAGFTPEMDERGEYLERLDEFAAAKIAAEKQ